MGFDIQQHDLVPEHDVLDEEEVDELLERFDITEDDLPVIDRKDAVVKQIGAEVGDVIEVTRQSKVAGETKYYRKVVEV